MTQPGSASDPLWYKDAIIYELHVRAFADSNNDGIGDLRGLIKASGSVFQQLASVDSDLSDLITNFSIT